MDVIEKEVFHLPVDEKTGQGSSHKRNPGREYKSLETTERLIYLFILPRNVGLTQKMQTEHTEKLN